MNRLISSPLWGWAFIIATVAMVWWGITSRTAQKVTNDGVVDSSLVDAGNDGRRTR